MSNQKTISKGLELPQFIAHYGYGNMPYERNRRYLQLYIPLRRNKSGKYMVCYENDSAGVFNTESDESVYDACNKMQLKMEMEKESWDEVDKADFVDAWGEDALNWLSQRS